MKVRVFYDIKGHIVSLMEMKEGEGPKAGIFPMPDCESCDIKLTEEQSKASLLALHTGYMIDITKGSPNLVQIRKGNTTAYQS